jgi:hypothetical protein
LPASELRTLIGDNASEVDVEPLVDSKLWGKRVSDERYALVARCD